MEMPKFVLSFIENEFTEDEGSFSTVASFNLVKTPDLDGHWGMQKHELVNFPNGDSVNVTAEVTKYGNHFYVNDGNKCLCAIHSSGSVIAHFLLPSGETAFAALEIPNDDLRS